MGLSLNRLYELLADEEDARVCKDLDDSACQQVPGNFLLIFISQFFTKVGDALTNAKVVLPWLLSSVGAPAFFTGLLVPIRESGSLLPQLIFGGVVRGYALRKWFFVLGCVLQGLSMLVMAWLADRFTGTLAGVLIITQLILFSLARGLCSVASKDVLGKTIPKSRRGILGGYSDSAAGLVTLIVAIALAFNLYEQMDLHLLLVAAGLMWLVAAFFYGRIDEYAGASDGGGNALKKAFASLSILKTDSVFRRFVLVRCLLMSSGLSAPYFVLLTQQHDAAGMLMQLGVFVGASGVASMVSGVFWGRFADLSSRRVMLITAFLTGLLCALAAAFAACFDELNLWLGVGLFFLLSVVHQGVRLGRKTYLVDVAEEQRRTDYTAVSNTLIGVLLLVVGVFGAVLAQVSIVAALSAFALMSFAGVLLGQALPEA